MDKKYEDMSYREVHKQLEEAMQDALTSDEAGPFGSPEIDYSFMDSKPEKKNHSISGMSQFNKVAAIIVIALLGMNVVMMATGAGVSYSEKGLLHRIYEGARGIFTDEDESEYVEIDETGDTYLIRSMDNIDKAKQFWSSLYIPEYIPEGYELKTLLIEKLADGSCWAKYEFINYNHLIIIELIKLDDEEYVMSSNKGKLIELDDRIINIYWDEANQYYVIDLYFEDIAIYMRGDVSVDELEKIAKSIKN